MLPKKHLFCLVMLSLTPLLSAQQSDLQQVLSRLDRLEQENRELMAELRALRQALSSATPEAAAGTSAASATEPAPIEPAAQAPIPEQVATHEQRIRDLSQVKVESSQKFPVTLTGMVLFNSFLNGRSNAGEQYPTYASLYDHRTTAGGASVAQSIIGFLYQGPKIAGDGQVNASLNMDLWGGSNLYGTGYSGRMIRLRTANVSVDWKNTSFMVGQDKPIVSPRNPDSLAQVAYSPLTDAGNLWLWQPQARIEQRFSLGENAGIRARLGVYQTSEPSSSAGVEYLATLAQSRPALQGRFELWRTFGRGARIEIAPGFHRSDTHVGGISIPSRLFTLDWLIQPVSRIQISGAFFQGRNAAGLGGLRQGFTIVDDLDYRSVQAAGGWSQVSFQATSRLTFNIYGGQESNQPSDLLRGQISRNLSYAGNALYRIAPNVILGIEAAQVRTAFLGYRNRLNNHYDVALAYLF